MNREDDKKRYRLDRNGMVDVNPDEHGLMLEVSNYQDGLPHSFDNEDDYKSHKWAVDEIILSQVCNEHQPVTIKYRRVQNRVAYAVCMSLRNGDWWLIGIQVRE